MKQPPAIVPAILALALAGCADRDAAVVTIAPTLACAERIRCEIFEWQLGVRYGPKLTGTHIGCRCLAGEK